MDFTPSSRDDSSRNFRQVAQCNIEIKALPNAGNINNEEDKNCSNYLENEGPAGMHGVDKEKSKIDGACNTNGGNDGTQNNYSNNDDNNDDISGVGDKDEDKLSVDNEKNETIPSSVEEVSFLL